MRKNWAAPTAEGRIREVPEEEVGRAILGDEGWKWEADWKARVTKLYKEMEKEGYKEEPVISDEHLTRDDPDMHPYTLALWNDK